MRFLRIFLAGFVSVIALSPRRMDRSPFLKVELGNDWRDLGRDINLVINKMKNKKHV